MAVLLQALGQGRNLHALECKSAFRIKIPTDFVIGHYDARKPGFRGSVPVPVVRGRTEIPISGCVLMSPRSTLQTKLPPRCNYEVLRRSRRYCIRRETASQIRNVAVAKAAGRTQAI